MTTPPTAAAPKKIRLIAKLEIKGRNVVKGIRMEGLRVVGTPEDMLTRYYQQGADELLFIDTVASLYGRNHLGELLSMVSESIFVPLVVGGGVRGIEDFHRLLSSGADKVSLNTQAVKTPELITQAAETFGSQCVVVSIQAKLKEGRYEPYLDNGRERSRLDAVAWAKEAESRGAGELLVTSVDRDGTCYGLDQDLLRRISDAVRIPVIAAGGAKSGADIAQTARAANIDACAVAHILHFGKETVGGLKDELKRNGIQVRPQDSETTP